MKILITGASGSGTTTLGKALAKHLGCQVLDADDFYWLPTTPAYQQKRSPEDRLALILSELADDTIVTGSIMNWGQALENAFDLIVFLTLDTEIRIKRLAEREQQEQGFVDPEFLAWAREYDNDGFTGRNRIKHEHWLANRLSKTITVAGDLTIEQRLDKVLTAINGLGKQK